MKDKQGYTEFHLELLSNTCEISIIKRHSTIHPSMLVIIKSRTLKKEAKFMFTTK